MRSLLVAFLFAAGCSCGEPVARAPDCANGGCEPPDAGPALACDPGSTQACGAAGSACVQRCSPDGVLGACEGPAGPVDTKNDPAKRGQCGAACPAPRNAVAVCRGGVCGRTACAPGTFDFDGAETPGCEASCQGAQCTLGDGSTVTLDAPPVPEGGARLSTFASGSSFGPAMQTSAQHTNTGVLGEGTPPPANGDVSRNATHSNRGGLTSLLR